MKRFAFTCLNKKKYWILLLPMFAFQPSNWTQKKSLLELKKGKIIFMSYAPQEIIRAESGELKGLINPENSTFAIVVNNNSFKGFNSDLQREHFNERFIETEKYNTCSFSGKIIEKVDLNKEGTYQVRTRGKLAIHGVSEDRVIPVTIKVVSGTVMVSGKFLVALSDHEISVPAIVNQKIAENIEVSFTALFESK